MDSDWSRERLAQLLYEAWTAVAHGHTPPVSSMMPVPGDIGLRGRFHYLDDAEQRGAVPASAFRISRDRWDAQLAAARRGDVALTGQDSAGAQAAFQQLRALWEPGACELPVVDALIGLADTARQDDAVDDAIGLCQQAIATAERIRYRFGEIRALTALGYLMLRSGSAAGSAETFQRAADQAEAIDERLYKGNALTGRGEALARLRQFNDAKAALAQAQAIFVGLRSDAGIANAAQHLGDLHRRLRELDPAEAALSTAYEASERAGQVIGMVNAADALGEVHLGGGDVETAMRCYERAYAISEKHGYRRGQAHAHAGVARAALTAAVYDVADAEFAAAADIFGELDDMTSTAIAVSGRARCAEATGDIGAHVRLRLEAVSSVEAIRSAQAKHLEQVEYVDRFADVYAEAFRAAIDAQDGAAFVAVFEAVAGRRLAAMLAAAPTGAGDVPLLGQLLARANARPLDGADLTGDLPDDHGRRTRRARLLGRLALRGALPGNVEAALDDVVTALVRPFDPAAAQPMLGSLPSSAHVLLIAKSPGHGDRLVWLWRASGGSPVLGQTELGADVVSQLTGLTRNGLATDATLSSVAPLAGLVPDVARQQLRMDDRLLLVPVGDLWSVPWPALPAANNGALLGETVALAVAPSLSVATALPGQGLLGVGAHTAWWVGPDVMHQSLRAYDGDNRVSVTELPDAATARTAITAAGADMVVVFAHGRPAEGIGHFLELGPDELLTPMDLLTAHTPVVLALISCWGARTPAAPPGDPLTLATLALVRGSRAVLATTAELADDPAASAFINDVLYRLIDLPPAVAVRDATRRWLARPQFRADSIMMWAPLVTIGSWGDK